jgi:hypothetical protein
MPLLLRIGSRLHTIMSSTTNNISATLLKKTGSFDQLLDHF